MRDGQLEKGFHLRIARNRTGSIFNPNKEYWKLSRVKIIKLALPEGRDISMRNCAHEKVCRLKIARNRMGSVFRPNNEYSKRLRVKLIKGAVLRGPGYYRERLGVQKRLSSQNRAKSHGLHI